MIKIVQTRKIHPENTSNVPPLPPKWIYTVVKSDVREFPETSRLNKTRLIELIESGEPFSIVRKERVVY